MHETEGFRSLGNTIIIRVLPVRLHIPFPFHSLIPIISALHSLIITSFMLNNLYMVD